MPTLASFGVLSAVAALGLVTSTVGCSSSPAAGSASGDASTSGLDSSGTPANDASTSASDASAEAADGGDAGAMGVGAFVGTWTRSGTLELTCGIHIYDYPITGTLSIVLGATSDTITTTASDTGCTETYSVAGNVATATTGQTCTPLADGGSQTVLTAVKHTLTVSGDGTTLAEAATDTVTISPVDGGAESCTASSTGSFTKQ